MTITLKHVIAVLCIVLQPCWALAAEVCKYDMPPVYQPTSQDLLIRGMGDLDIRLDQLRSESPVVVQYQDYELSIARGTFNLPLLQFDGERIVLKQTNFVLNAKKASVDFKHKHGNLETVTYWRQESHYVASGQASRLRWQGQSWLLDEATFSICPANRKTWQLSAESVKIDNGDPYVTLVGPALRLWGYHMGLFVDELRYPIGDARASGWLAPKVSINSRLGLGAGVPYFYVIDAEQDVQITPIIFSRPALLLMVNHRYINNDFFYKTDLYLIPRDKVASANSRYAFSLEVKSNPDLDFNVYGHWQRVGDRWWTRDYGYIERDNQFFIPSVMVIEKKLDEGMWKVELRHSQFLETDQPSTFRFNRLPQITYKQKFALTDQMKLAFSSQYTFFSPVGNVRDDVQSGFRFNGKVGPEFNQDGTSGHLYSRWLWHLPEGQPAKLLLVPDLQVQQMFSFQHQGVTFTPSYAWHWVNSKAQSGLPLYVDPGQEGINLLDQTPTKDRIFDRSDLTFSLAAQKGDHQFILQQTYAVQRHEVCIDPGCDVDWLAKHHLSPLQVGYLKHGGEFDLKANAWLINADPFVDRFSGALVFQDGGTLFDLNYQWQRKYYNPSQNELISSASQLTLDLQTMLEENWRIQFSPRLIYDGRAKLGYNSKLSYHDCCFSVSVGLNLAPRTYDSKLLFSHRPEFSFQLSFMPTLH